MNGLSKNSTVRPYALGITPQTSIYGSTIPVVYGRTRGTLYLIWAANLRQTGGSAKTLKAKKGNPKTYGQNIDMLVGTNPISAILQVWENGSVGTLEKIPMNFAIHSTHIVPGGVGSLSVSDPAFYCIVGVTFTPDSPLSQTFNDFGGQGSATITDVGETPMWNSAFAGPDRANISGWRWYPYTYRGSPTAPNTIIIDQNTLGALPAGTVNIHYAQLLQDTSGNNIVPIARAGLTFEPILGCGAEFVGLDQTSFAALTDWLIAYPMYAGVSSPSIDMGATQAMPNIVPEVLGAFTLYASGDADYADMIEDIFKGVGQTVNLASAVGSSGVSIPVPPPYSEIYHGLNCYDFPALIQKVVRTSASSFTAVAQDMQCGIGDILICVARNNGGSGLAISDTRGNSWTPLYPGPPTGYQVWTAIANASGQNTVTVTPGGTHCDIQVLELSGLDTPDLDNATSGTNGPVTGAVVCTNNPGEPALILAIMIGDSSASGVQPSVIPQHWKAETVGQGLVWVMSRVVYYPGTYTFSADPGYTGSWKMLMVSFKNSQPVSWPKPLGNILDDTTMQMLRNQCRAFGMTGSLICDSQKKGADYLQEMYDAAVGAPVWSGFKLKSIPYGEASNVGNGAIYRAPQMSDIGSKILVLSIADFIADNGNPPFVIDRPGQGSDTPNIFKIQYPNRNSDYNDVIASQPENSTISIFGGRNDNPKMFRSVQAPDVASKLLGVMARKANYLRMVPIKFTLRASIGALADPMDILLLPPDPASGTYGPFTEGEISGYTPVRLKSTSEDKDYNLQCEAEPYIYGVYSPAVVAIGVPAPYIANKSYVPQLINTPIIFEPVPALAGFPNVNEVRFVISNSDPGYGGCQVYISTDGGNSYQLIDTIHGNAITGVLGATWPESIDPDTTNDLQVDLTESLGALPDFTADQKNGFVFPCYVETTPWANLSTSGAASKTLTDASASGLFNAAMIGQDFEITTGTDFVPGVYVITSFIDANNIGLLTSPTPTAAGSGGGGNLTIPYELMTYAIANMTSAYHYTLQATGGGAVNGLRRAVAGAALPQEGTYHASGARFAFLDPAFTGSGAVQLDPNWIGKQLMFKFVAFNQYGGGFQNIADVTPYDFTPSGITAGVSTYANSVNYYLQSLTGPFTPSPLSQAGTAFPGFPLEVAIQAFIAVLPTQKVRYRARPIIVGATGVTSTDPWFVNIYDPNYQGDFNLDWSDLASIAGSFHLTSASGTFTSALVGQFIYITSGTNFIPDRYQVDVFINSTTVHVTGDPTTGSNASAGNGSLQAQTFVEKSPMRVGRAGYIYVGAIYPKLFPGSPLNATITPGGWPPAVPTLMNQV